MPKAISLAIAAVAALGLSGCSTFNWRDAGTDIVQNACDGASNCDVVCPDGTVTDPNFPRCEPTDPLSMQID